MRGRLVDRAIMRTMSAGERARYHEEANRENRLAIRLLALSGIPMAAANMVVQIALSNGEMLSFLARTGWVLVYFVLLLVAERWLIPEDCRHAAVLLYIVEAPILLGSIMLGSVWDPDHQAITFFIFLMALPAFVLDRPLRVVLVSAGWVALFLIMCYLVKPFDIFERDLLHVFEFFLASIVVANVVIRIRMIATDRLIEVRHSLEHDELTDLRNRRSLECHMGDYLGKALTVSIAELDQLDLFNDVYGHDAGNRILIRSSEILVEAFGKDRVYRYGGDEALCVVEGSSVEECEAAIEACQAKLRDFEVDGRRLNPTCAVGYTIGTPQTVEEFHQMVQLAVIYSHKAGQRGKGQTVGGFFDANSLKEGIIESNVDANGCGYETNQLTGLPSMSFFVSRADNLLATIIDPALRPIIGFITLPQIKSFNNKFGYAQGDALIRFAAKRLGEAFPERMICCITGAQFGVMCYEDEIEPGMRKLGADLAGFKEGYTVICKAGFAKYADGESAILLLDKARIAEGSIREHFERSFRIYDAQLDEDAKLREYVVTHLDEAIERGYLEVYYQPIICTATREICDEEALSRWNDPEHGLLAPYRFIPPLEESRQVYKLSLHVVRQVLADFKRKREAGLVPVPVSVNLSRHDFEQCDMVQAISKLVDAAGFSRDMLRIEITESAFTKNQELLKREVARFRASGFEVWMDDFGSEYSTLSLLQDLDFDLVKLDMEFMRHSSDSGRNLIIVANVLNMIKQMGIATLVEGVECEEHLGILRGMGCDKMQGYLFSKPLPLQTIIDNTLSVAEGAWNFNVPSEPQ